MRRRKSGILLHPTSLPGPWGIGSLGGHAHRFCDFLAAAGQSIWQVLPLGPTGYGGSPYSCYSAFAGNPLLVDLAEIAREGDLTPDEIAGDFPEGAVDFDLASDFKLQALRGASARFFRQGDEERKEEFARFCSESAWLHDYVLFMALKEANSGKAWTEWPEELTLRRPEALERAARELAGALDEHRYMQWQFFRQWHRVKEHANSRGIEVFGDIPIFVAGDSVDVWANPQLFHLDEHRRPTVVAGVPPDYFSATGQLWGNPLYDWGKCRKEGYRWWIDRIRASHELYDIIRIDHFRGFAAYWEVPASETTAVNGRWATGPGGDLFSALADALGELPIVAEDLGTITPDVEELRDRFSFPGMKVLQFAFDSGPANPYLPHNHTQDMVVYTGTHDNDTTLGWYMSQAEHQKQRIRSYLNISGDDLVWDMIRAAMASVCDRAVIPLQDVLCLGTEAKMNRPGTARGNWSWRFREGDLQAWQAERLRELSQTYGRT